MWRRYFIFILILHFAIITNAQRHGVCPIDMNDRQTDQLFDSVHTVSTIIHEADFSRHIAEKGAFISASLISYFEDGNIDRERISDEQGELLSLIIYQYRDGYKYVSTAYDSNDTRTLQTLYDYDDGVCTFMRLTDAIAVTISTTNIKHGADWAEMSERFLDGETVNERFEYNKKGRLVKHTTSGSADQNSEMVYTLGKNGQPTKAQLKQKGVKHNISYEYELDAHNNWTRRITYIDGIAKEIATREITYF